MNKVSQHAPAYASACQHFSTPPGFAKRLVSQ
jgi:hypothetical protein